MKKFLLFITICILASCGENDSDLRSLTERENEELFQKNYELIKSIEERNYFLESKIDSLIDQQIKINEKKNSIGSTKENKRIKKEEPIREVKGFD